MKAALPLLLALAASAAAPPQLELSLAAKAQIARLEASASRSATFRRLLAETRKVPRKAGRLDGTELVRYEPPPSDRLIFDEAALKTADEWEFQLAEARQLARASMALPGEIREAELAAVQQQLHVLLELVAGQPGMANRVALLAEDTDPPPGVLGRVAFAAALLSSDPEDFYAEAGRCVPGLDEAVRLPDLEDFLALHGAALASLDPVADQAYVRVEGRRYPAALVAAARALRPLGGAARVREAIGARDEDAAELSKKLRQWLR